MNWRDPELLLAAATIVIAALLIVVFVPQISAAPDNNVSYPRITQGSIVYLNETYDISGVTGWADKIAWYGAYAVYPDPSISPQVITLPGLTHTSATSQYYYYIDPAIFTKYPGDWFQYYGTSQTAPEPNANLLAFRVEFSRPVVFNATNQSGVISYNVLNNVTTVNQPVKPFILPTKMVSDYIVARGDDLNVTVNQSTHVWIFGRVDGVYDRATVNNSVDFQRDVIQSLEPGAYKILMQTPIDPNITIFTVKYDADTNTIRWFQPDTFTVNSLLLDGMSPMVVLDKLEHIFPQSRDTYKVFNLAVQEPYVSIERFDTAWINGAEVLDVRGYTNVANDTPISVTLDPQRQTVRSFKENTFIGYVQDEGNGNMRDYRVLVPIDPNNMANGMHTLEANTTLGGEVYHDFPIEEMPADSYAPNATVRYVGDRNPWVPTPTPVIEVHNVTGPMVTVIQTVTIPITPDQAQLDQTARKALDDEVSFWIVVVLLVVMAGIGGRWVFRMVQEARK